MLWPQWTILSMTFARIVLQGFLHGEKRLGKYNVGDAILGNGLWIFLLWKGGFFK